MELPYIIAVDFDGTLCENSWPDIGEAYNDIINYILYRQKLGARIILWTNRTGIYLERAVAWCKDRGLIFDAVNENLPEAVKEYGSDGRKIFADEFLDDSAAKGVNRFIQWKQWAGQTAHHSCPSPAGKSYPLVNPLEGDDIL